MPLRTAFCPRQIIEIAGQEYEVWPLRLNDLAAFEAMAFARLPDPMADLEPEPAATYPDRLRRAYDAALAGGPEWGEPGCQAALGTDAAVLYLIQAVFRHPVYGGDAEARRIASLMTAENWTALRRIAYDSNPTRQIEALIDRHIGVTFEPADTVDGLSWSEAAASVCHALSKMPSEIGEMTIPEVRFILTNGKTEPYESARPDNQDEADKIEDKRAAFWQGWNSTP